MKYTLIAALLLIGCRKHHLGDDTGRAYREGFAAQRESDPEVKPEFHGSDAKQTMAARRGDKKPGGGTTTTTGSGTLTVPVSTGNAGAWPGAAGPITLEAK